MSIKANILAAFVGIGALFMAAAPAHALLDPNIPGLTYTGLSYTSPFGGAHRTTVEADIEALLGPGSDAYYIDRMGPSTATSAPYLQNGDDLVAAYANMITGQCNDSNCGSGTWAFNPGTLNLVIAFVEISTGGDSRLYRLDTFGLSGLWNTNALSDPTKNAKKLSHMDFYAVLAQPTQTGVPEPAMLLLMALGMAGLAGISIRRRASVNA